MSTTPQIVRTGPSVETQGYPDVDRCQAEGWTGKDGPWNGKPRCLHRPRYIVKHEMGRLALCGQCLAMAEQYYIGGVECTHKLEHL